MNTIFALDSSGKTASVCLLAGERVLYQELLNAGLTHSETLLPLAQRAFERTGLAPERVGLYAVTGGPGSFTGLRIGMALVKGLALPHATPALQVSTLAALALGSELQGTVIPALDARRGEVYWAAFGQGAEFSRLLPDTAGPAADAAAFAAKPGGPVFFVGDGAEICYNAFSYGPNVRPAPDNQPNIALGAAQIARCQWRGGKPLPAAALRPEYQRIPQAERERNQR